MGSDPPKPLVDRVACGDSHAVEALLQKYLPGLRAFVRLRIGPELRAKESASDITQSVCRELIEGLEKFEWQSEEAFRSWLFTAALRKVADRAEHYRAGKRDVAREASPARSSIGDQSVWACYGSLSSPSQQAIAGELAEKIEQAFDALSAEEREIVTLAKIAGLSRAQIGERLGKSEGAVRMVLHRALARVSDFVGAG